MPRSTTSASTCVRVLVALIGLGSLMATVPPAGPPVAAADTRPIAASVPATVSSDPLPTTQIDGVAWTQLVVGDRVYVGGDFATARPAGAAPGTQTVPRSNLLAYDLESGHLVDDFAPELNGAVRAMAVSPDGSTLYVGGQFTAVDEVTRLRVVAFDLTTGRVKESFTAQANASVYGIASTASTVYIAGIFTTVNAVSRAGVAAVAAGNGSVLPFAVTPAGGTVRSVVISPDATKVVVGGSFTSMNNSSNPGYGMAMVNATSGKNLPLAVNSLIRNASDTSSITSLLATSDGFYGTGYNYTSAKGNLEGAFRANWDGTLNWIEDCHGDTYSLAVSREEVYVAGHPHYCGGVGAFPQTDPWSYHRGLAFTKAATQVLGANPQYRPNFTGQRGPSQLNWYPDLATGTYTGQTQGPWSVTATDDYVLYGGEFPTVNGQPQQGLVRFARSSIAPNDDGPRLGAVNAGLTARSYGANTLRLSWPANWDRDNERLTYRLFRDNVLLTEFTADSRFYRRPLLSYLDKGVVAGQTYSYKVKAADPYGNSAWSDTITAAAGTGSALSRYQSLVLSDGPVAYWPMNERTGTSSGDVAGRNALRRASGVQAGVAGPIRGESGYALRLKGSSSTSTLAASVAVPDPQTFSTEAWFRTTSTKGGQLIGLDEKSTGGSNYADRHLYLTNSGQVAMAVRPSGVARAIASPRAYRDGKWHHVVGTLGGDGMTLVIDGVRVNHSPTTKSGQYFGTRTGFWRVGGNNLSWVPFRPTSYYLAGDVDEVAVYPVALTAAQAKNHFVLGTTGVAPNVLPTAAFTAVAAPLSVEVDASGSADSDGTITTYAWNFGDNTSGSGVRATHVYGAAGRYVTTLTVADNRGGTATTSREIEVTERPNQAPSAAFTSSVEDLTLSVDGSTASDADGSVAEYRWDFDDGSTGTGATTEHTYDEAGYYAVKLTVTDNQGAENSITKVLAVSTDAEPIVLDKFNRSQASGLGSADLGGQWTTSPNSGFAVDDGRGVVKLPSAGASRTAYLGETTSTSAHLESTLTTDAAATGNGVYATVIGRRVAADLDYRLNMRFTAEGTLTASLGALQGSSTVVPLSSTVTVPGSYSPGTDVHVVLEVIGDQGSGVRAKVWLGSDPEPGSWTISATDSYPALQAAGSVGLVAYSSGSSTTPVNLLVERLLVTG